MKRFVKVPHIRRQPGYDGKKRASGMRSKTVFLTQFITCDKHVLALPAAQYLHHTPEKCEEFNDAFLSPSTSACVQSGTSKDLESSEGGIDKLGERKKKESLVE